jgi:hypothetical protein
MPNQLSRRGFLHVRRPTFARSAIFVSDSTITEMEGRKPILQLMEHTPDELIRDVFGLVKNLFTLVRSQQEQIDRLHGAHYGLLDALRQHFFSAGETPPTELRSVDREALERAQREITELERMLNEGGSEPTKVN